MSDDEMLPPNDRKSLKSSSQSSTNEILKTFQVIAFKYIDSRYENRGKIGLALLGSRSNNNFSILLYGKANVPLTQASINKDFEVTSSRDLYVSFYDSKSENWSIMFDSADYYIDFFNRITLLKLLTSKQDFSVCDIKVGEGAVVRENDLCEVEITVNGIKNCEILSILYNSESQEANKIARIKIGSNKLLPAIDKGIIGMMKGGHRIVCVLNNNNALLKGGAIKVPLDTGVIVHIKMTRIKPKTEKPTTIIDQEPSLPNLDFGTKTEAGEQSKRSELINRMKEIGKPIIMYQPIDDSQRNVETNSSASSNYNVHSSPAYENVSEYVQRPQSFVSNVPNQYNNQLLQNYPPNPVITSIQQFHQPLSNFPAASESNLVFTETRQHNTEMRIAISKLQDKIDRIADKIDSSNKKVSINRHMDAENVFENIKRIIDENEEMKRECSQKSETIDSQNKRINELLKKNQQYLEDTRKVFDKTSESFNSSDSENQNKILKLEEEKLELIRNLSKKNSELSLLELKTEALNIESQKHRNKSLEFSDELSKLTTELGDYKLKNRSLLTELEKLREDRTSILGVNEDLEKIKKQAEDNERKLKQNIETLKNNIKYEQSHTEQVKLDCDSEIMEIRQGCTKEIEELRKKLKQERRIINSKSSDLETEIESVNKEWEIKFESLKKLENSKLIKVNDRNSQLMAENSTLIESITDLKDQLSLVNSSRSSKFDDLSMKNRQLQEQFEDREKEVKKEIEGLRLENSKKEKLIEKMTEEKTELVKVQGDLEVTIQRKRELESMVISLTEELNVKSQMNVNNDIDGQIKAIMNDVFKKIKFEFELEKNYTGKDVHGKCMIIIRDSTVSRIKSKEKDESDSEIQEGSDSEQSDYESSETNSVTKELVNVLEDLKESPIKNALNNSENCLEPMEHSIIKEVRDIKTEVVKEEYTEEVKEESTQIIKEESTEVVKEESTEVVKEESAKVVKEESTEEEKIIEDIDNQEYLQEKEELSEVDKYVDNCEYDILENNEFDIKSDQPAVRQFEEIKIENDEGLLITSKQESNENDKTTEIISNNSEMPPSDEAICTIDINDTSKEVNDKDKLTTSEINKKSGALFSDDEDEDVLDFFEQLSQKKKVEIKKPVSSMGDDEFSWLNS